MLYTLKGKIIIKKSHYIVLDNHGLGYQVFLLPKALTEISKNQELFLFLYHHSTEKGENLYGFFCIEERELFEALNSVSGIGPKKAMDILNSTEWQIIYQASLDQNPELLERAGLTTLLAEKVVNGLKRKIDQLEITARQKIKGVDQLIKGREVVEALKNLGYKEHEVKQALSKTDQSLNIENKIKECLKLLSN